MPRIRLGRRDAGDNEPVYVIAEIGINHQGDVQIARKCIDEAARSGADAVKFQKRKIDRILTREGLDKPYDNPNSFGKTYGEHKAALELSENDYQDLAAYAEAQNLDFIASGWDEDSIDFLDELGVNYFKMASADLTNFPLLLHTARKNKPMVLSTGMADMNMVKEAVKTVLSVNPQLAILQCTSTYPSQFSEINLNVLTTYREAFPDAVIGYSGHELGIAITEAAVVLGAKIIERHFTLDRTMKGGDHAASLEPGGFAKMVRDIRHIEAALGNGIKTVQESENAVFKKLAKSIVTAVAIPSGTPLTREMLTTKGPGTGISPMRLNELIGKRLNTDLAADMIIPEGAVEW